MTMLFELNPIDRHFADFIFQESGGESLILKPVVSLLSNAVGNGNICLNLEDITGKEIRVDGEEITFPDLGKLHDSLRGTTVVGLPGEFKPLVLDGKGRLYLYRY